MDNCVGSCEGLKCTAYQHDPANYRTRHRNDGCKCQELVICQKLTTEILETGSLPLIHINEYETLAELSVEIVASQPTSLYVALSHIWADGLGNPKANALPRCQVSYLREILTQLKWKADPQDDPDDQEIMLWVDTLCCPVEPEKANNLALEQMFRTYEQGRCVLVLDNSLRMHSLEALGLDEVCARILYSPWMRRLWTLQEGALSAKKHRLWFQFKRHSNQHS